MLEQTKAQVPDLRLGITTQERITKPAPVNLSTSGQLESVPESEYNLPETEPSAHDAAVGDRPTQIPASNPQASSATIPKSNPMPRNFSEVSTATRDSTRTPRPDFRENPRPTHDLATPKPPSSTLDLDPDVTAPPRKPSVNQGLSDIRIYSAQRKNKGIRIIPKIEDIPGKHVIVYNPDTYQCAVREKHDINCKHQQAPLC